MIRRPSLLACLSAVCLFSATGLNSNVAQAGFIANLQFVSYCENDGTQCGNVSLDVPAFNNTWAQADITFNILPTLTLNQSSIVSTTDIFASLFAHQANVNGTLGGPDPFTLYMGVARDVAGGIPSAGFVGAPYAIVDGSLGPALFQTRQIAHEIGHMLGLVDNDGNPFPASAGLMAPITNPSNPEFGLFGPQVTTVQQSPFLQQVAEIPEPGLAALFGLTVIGLAVRRRR